MSSDRIDRIRVLDASMARLIAAGEVIERPVSVVKELVENSIDAGSSGICIEIENGGLSKINVADNGRGIAKDDVRIAFLRHATSKLRTEDDLSNISTLGFRGEALASIAAVSRVRILTRTKYEVAGTRLELEAGAEKFFDADGCSQGTRITVSDLFFNLPARMKFLGKDQAEAAAVSNLLEKLALSHPEVAFKFVKDGMVKFSTPGDGRLESVAAVVFGREIARALLPVEFEQDNLKLAGWIASPQVAKVSRSGQIFFVNGRFATVRLFGAALEGGYKNLLVVGRHPLCALNLKVPYQFVDVNVHPAKTSVKFMDDKIVYSLIYHGVKTALQKASQPEISKDPKKLFAGLNPESPQLNAPTISDIVKYKESGFLATSEPLSRRIDEILNNQSLPMPMPNSELLVDVDSCGSLGNLVFKGEVLSTYIICQRGEDVVLVDKHALHENLLFDELVAQKSDTLAMQMLMLPSVLTMRPEEHSVAVQNKDLFLTLGFDIDDFGDNSIIVRAVPIDLFDKDLEVLVGEIVKQLGYGTCNISLRQRERILYAIACKAAVKAGDKNTTEELKELVARLNQKEGLVCCPHGRPVSCVLRRPEIEKWFKR
jgi:DNA mismatch repair protein MutL